MERSYTKISTYHKPNTDFHLKKTNNQTQKHKWRDREGEGAYLAQERCEGSGWREMRVSDLKAQSSERSNAE